MQSLRTGTVCLSSGFIILCLVLAAGCPCGSGRPFSGCSSLSLVVVWEDYNVLWGRGGQRTLPELGISAPPWQMSGDWRSPAGLWQQSCQAKEERGNWGLFPKHTHLPHTWMDHAHGQVSAEALERSSEKGRSWHFQWETLSQAFVCSHSVLIIYDCGDIILMIYYLKILRFRANTCLLKYKEQRW